MPMEETDDEYAAVYPNHSVKMNTVEFIGCRIDCIQGETKGMFVKNGKPWNTCPDSPRCPYGEHKWDQEYWKTHKVIYK
jgi:hypothetical protein